MLRRCPPLCSSRSCGCQTPAWSLQMHSPCCLYASCPLWCWKALAASPMNPVGRCSCPRFRHFAGWARAQSQRMTKALLLQPSISKGKSSGSAPVAWTASGSSSCWEEKKDDLPAPAAVRATMAGARNSPTVMQVRGRAPMRGSQVGGRRQRTASPRRWTMSPKPGSSGAATAAGRTSHGSRLSHRHRQLTPWMRIWRHGWKASR
mmetsp:Transcript_21119/g.61647  ORF Transcript_21119/g.61647 Transcript_21119/m.61647 type:complete len:205 (-) Transcript_21119:1027-1641(-)